MPRGALSDDEIHARIATVPHWYHQIEIRPGIVTPGINNSAATLAQLRLPERCDGLRVLDVGVRDGFFSFEFERRGAEVVAIDYIDPEETGFLVARELLGSQVKYTVDNVYNVTPERYGTFDIVLFLGVIYHLRDPLLALDRLWDVCGEGALLALETQLLDNRLMLRDGTFRTLAEAGSELGDVCLMQFYPGDSLNGDATNYWAPNAACVRALLGTAGFEVTNEVILGSRGLFVGRQFMEPMAVYQRTIEKATVVEGQEWFDAHAGVEPDAPDGPDGPDEPDGPEAPNAAGSADDEDRLRATLAVARKHQLALESELGRARAQIETLNRRPFVGGERVRRALGALRRRVR
jgi:tRNA (mo5U34)-methyltransferase